MRKVLSFVLVLALVLGSFSMAFAATPTDVVGQPSEEAVQVLMGLGVVAGYADGTYKPAQAVTRAEMAKLIVVALGLEDYAIGTSKFADMAGATWAQGYVNYAAGLGVILGYPDGTFKPSQTVSYDEAAAMIVRALGYTDASLTGTWPTNYVVKAKALGILDGIKAAIGGANRGDIAEMLFNSLSLDIGYVDTEGVWHTYADNMFDRLGATHVDAAVIEGDEDTAINLRAYVGVYAETYLNSDDEIISVVPKSDTLTGSFDGEATFTADDVDYTLSTAAQVDLFDATVASTSAIEFYNGATVGAAATTTTSSITYTLAVDLSSKTIKEVYSANKWVVSDNFLFDADMTDEIIDDLTVDSNDFAQNDNDDIDLNSFQLLGASNLAALKADDVVYVYSTSSTALITKIEVGTTTATGKVTRISSDGDYTIGGKVLTLGVANQDVPAIGDTGTARLDYAGEIYDWTVEDTTAGNYALVIATATGTSIDSARVKLIDKTGSTSTFDIASDADYTTTFGALAKGDLVEFSTDSDGVIDSILERTKQSLATGTVSDNGKVVSGKQIATDTVVFTSTSLGAMTATATDFDVATVADLAGETLTGAYYYDETTADGVLEVIIVDAAFTGSASNYAVINTTSSAINADGDTVVYVEGFKDGVAFNAYTDGQNFALGFSAATLYDLTIDGAGVITDATAVTTAISSQPFVNNQLVAAKDGNLVQINTTWYTVDPNVVVYELNTTDDKYVVKSMSSVKANAYVTMWQADTDSDIYDIIVIIN